jgi:hypothetical protein
MTPGTRVPFTETELRKLEVHLRRELDESLEEHLEMESRIDEWQRAYDGEPVQKRRTFPWPGAANLEVPLIGFTVDAIVARIVNTMFAPEPFWTIRPLRKEVDNIAKPIEHYMDWSRKSEYDLYKTCRTWIPEVAKLGWGWLKLGWEVFSRRDYVLDEGGALTARDEVVRRPMIYHILARDMIMQADIQDEEQAEWLCHRFRLTDNDLRRRKVDSIYESALVDDLIKRGHDSDSEAVRSTPYSKTTTMYEFSIDYPYGPDEAPTPMTITWHHGLGRVARAIFQPYGWRPYVKAKFIEREGSREGFGIARRLAQLQEELSTIHRQQVDNATVANTRFFLGKRGVVRPDTRIWPGRFLPVNDPDRDIKPIQMGEIYPSMRALEIQALSYAERASGISDPQLGREASTLGSRATATGTLAMIQEGNRRFDLNVRDIRESLSKVGRRVLELNQRFRPRGVSYFVEGEDGRFVEAVLDLPPEFSASKLAVELTASTATINREVEKQGLIALLGVITNYYQQLAQVGMLVFNPQVPAEMRELGIRMAEGAKHVVERIVQDFDIRDVDKVVPGLLNEQATSEALRGSAGPAGAGPQPGMEGLLGVPGGPNGPGAPGTRGVEQLQ